MRATLNKIFVSTFYYEIGLQFFVYHLSEAVLQKCSSEGILKMYSKFTETHRFLKCDLNKAPLQLYWNHTSAWVFSCKFAAYFQNTFI